MNAQQHDLAIMVSVNKDTAKIGEDMVFVVRVRNEGKTNLTNVSVKLWLSPGLKYMSSTAPANTTYNNQTKIWYIGNITSSQFFTTFYIRTQVTRDGVNSIFAEIQSANEKDIDSTPANNLFNEDDIQLKSVSTPMDFCVGEKIYITARGALGFATYQWYKNGIAIKDSTDRSFTITEPGEYRYTVNSAQLGNCQGELCVPIIVRYRSSSTLVINQPAAVCGNKVIDLTSTSIINAIPTGGSFSYYTNFTDAKNSINNIPLSSVKNTVTSGNYFVRYALNGACAVIDTVKVKINPAVNAVAASPKSVTCISSSVTLNSTGSTTGTDIAYNWAGPNNFTSTTPSPLVNSAGVYTLTVTNTKTGCYAMDTAIVVNNNYAVKVFAGNDTTITKGQSVALNAKVSGGFGPYVYKWLPPTGLSSSKIANPVATPQATSVYNLIVTDVNGCQGGDLIKITVTGNLTGSGTGNKSMYTMICETGNGLPMLNLNMRLKGDTNDGTWTVVSGTTKNQFDTTTGLFNPNGLLSGTYVFKYTIADSPNEVISEEEVTIKIEQCNTAQNPHVTHPITVIKNN